MRTWDILPDPIPDKVLHYSQLLSAESPNHHAPPLHALPEFNNPYDLDECHPIEEDDIPLVPSKDQYTPVALPLISSPWKDIDDDNWVSLGDNDSDTNLLEKAFSHSESTSSVTLPVQWESSEDDHNGKHQTLVWSKIVILKELTHSTGSVIIETSFKISTNNLASL